MSNIRKYVSEDVTAICNRELDLFEQITVFDKLKDNFDLITISDYVRKTGMNEKTVRNRVKAEKIPVIEIAGVIFIIQKLI